MKYNLSGWIKQNHDSRDRVLRFSRRELLALSPTTDLQKGMGPQLNQGDEGSCGPHTAVEMIEFDQILQGSPVVQPSRNQIYYACRTLMGTTGSDSGVDNRTLLKSLAQFGYAPESLWPYTDADMLTNPPASVWQAALPFKISNYAAVPQDLNSMKATISGGHPFMFGFSVFQQMMSDAAAATGIIADPSGSSIGGHDVTYMGYSDVDAPGVLPGNKWPAGTFKFRNHWLNADGTPWGDGGYGYISYAYSTNPSYASDFWVINSVNIGAQPSPQPSPQPVPSGLILTLSAAEDAGQIMILGGGRISMGSFSGPVPAGRYNLVAQ